MHSTYAAHVLIHGTTSITGLLPGRLFFKVLKSWKWQFSVFQGSLLVSLAQSPRHQLLVLLLLSCFHCVRLCATSSMAAHQAPCPWDSPGKNTGVGCHFLLQCMKVKSESEVAQSCLTLSDPVDCSPPGPLSMGLSRQEYWSGLSLPSPRTSAEQAKPVRIHFSHLTHIYVLLHLYTHTWSLADQIKFFLYDFAKSAPLLFCSFLFLSFFFSKFLFCQKYFCFAFSLIRNCCSLHCSDLQLLGKVKGGENIGMVFSSEINFRFLIQCSY